MEHFAWGGGGGGEGVLTVLVCRAEPMHVDVGQVQNSCQDSHQLQACAVLGPTCSLSSVGCVWRLACLQKQAPIWLNSMSSFPSGWFTYVQAKLTQEGFSATLM